jgi:hypothetical protein
MNVITKEQDFEFRRGMMMEKINAIGYYHQTKQLIEKLEKQIQALSEDINSYGNKNFKNSRHEMLYLHDVKTLTVVQRQRDRLKQKLDELQCRIQSDIELAKIGTNTQ